MKTTELRRLGALLMAGLLFLSSCQEDKTVAPDQDPETEAAEVGIGQSAMDDVSTFVENEGLVEGTGKTDGGDNVILGPCRQAVRDATVTDSTITITFTGMACADGKTRSGTIRISWDRTKTWRETGKTVTVRSSDYTVNGVTHKFRSLHTLTAGMPQPTWTRVTNDTISVAGQTGTGLWSANQTRVLRTGWNVPVGQRVWAFYGTTAGTSRRGVAWNSTVANVQSEHVVFQPGVCFFPTQGKITVTRSDKSLPRVVTFGPGCKNTYTVTVGVFTIELPFRGF